MMLSEFIERTGFEPLPCEYEKIEEAYYNFDGNKDAFCRAFVQADGERKVYQARAAEIDRLNSRILELDRTSKRDGAEYEKRLADLQAQLDRELEWKPCDGGTTLAQSRYEALAGDSSTRTLTDQEAKELIHQEFGFDPEKVTILRTVSTYEADRHSRMRKAATYTREPVYNATDWNYIRFDCANWMYEMVNGELERYCC